MPTYIVAVSGGVDSVVLLDMLVHGRIKTVPAECQLVVAHFDHGIRSDSGADADFVAKLADTHALPFELGSAKLGAAASEEIARAARYNFLRQCARQHQAAGIITAHHQDDLMETAIINLIRGTGWRGLASLESTDSMLRPLLSTPKSKLLEYAHSPKLEWREDSTNSDQSYLRNYVRHTLVPHAQTKNPDFKSDMLERIAAIGILKPQIVSELQTLVEADSLQRYDYIMWPESVALEVIYCHLAKLDPDWHPSQLQLQRALYFIKTAQPGKQLEVSKSLKIVVEKQQLQFKKV